MRNLRDNTVVHCPTRELFDKVKQKAGNKGNFKWEGRYGEENCYRLYDGDNSPLDYCQDYGYTIISASDYLKADIFNVGDRVECVKNYNHIRVGHQGRFVKSGITSLGVRWDNPSTGNHDMEGMVEQRYGYYVPESNLKLATNNQTKTTKEETMNKNIVAAFPKTDDAVLVEDQLGDEIKSGFINGLVIKQYSKEILAEAKRLKAEEDK